MKTVIYVYLLNVDSNIVQIQRVISGKYLALFHQVSCDLTEVEPHMVIAHVPQPGVGSVFS
jgi:hypothetical protein